MGGLTGLDNMSLLLLILSAEDTPPLAELVHLAGSPLSICYATIILPTLNLQKHKKAAYIPHWRGEAKWQLQARS